MILMLTMKIHIKIVQAFQASDQSNIRFLAATSGNNFTNFKHRKNRPLPEELEFDVDSASTVLIFFHKAGNPLGIHQHDKFNHFFYIKPIDCQDPNAVIINAPLVFNDHPMSNYVRKK